MGQATPLALRKAIISLRLLGKTHGQISQVLNIPYGTVKHIWVCYQRNGDKGLELKYANSGVKTIRSDGKLYRASLWLKRLHPTWGAMRIRIGLLSRYNSSIVPSERSMQRWFRKKKSH